MRSSDSKRLTRSFLSLVFCYCLLFLFLFYHFLFVFCFAYFRVFFRRGRLLIFFLFCRPFCFLFLFLFLFLAFFSFSYRDFCLSDCKTSLVMRCCHAQELFRSQIPVTTGGFELQTSCIRCSCLTWKLLLIRQSKSRVQDCSREFLRLFATIVKALQNGI